MSVDSIQLRIISKNSVGTAGIGSTVKTVNQLLAGKQTLNISPVERKTVLAASKGGLSFSCNGIYCACSGDLDCNDMFSHNVCGIRAICYDNVDRPRRYTAGASP